MGRATAVLLLAVLAVGCKPAPAAPDYSTGEFQVVGSGAVTHANIYYQAFDGAGMNVLYNVDVTSPGWSHSFSGVQVGDEYFLAAQSNDDATVPGDVLTIDVLVDGTSLGGPKTTTDPFGYVALYGTVP